MRTYGGGEESAHADDEHDVVDGWPHHGAQSNVILHDHKTQFRPMPFCTTTKHSSDPRQPARPQNSSDPHNTETVNTNITRSMQLYGILDRTCIHNTKGSLLGHRGCMGVLTNSFLRHTKVIVGFLQLCGILDTPWIPHNRSHHEVTQALWEFGQTVYTQFKGVIVRSLQLCGILDTIQKGPRNSL